MKEVRGKVYEEFGLKAHKKGFFNQWQILSSTLSQSHNLLLHEAAEKAYKQLKFGRSE